jgi:hypothetical protein
VSGEGGSLPDSWSETSQLTICYCLMRAKRAQIARQFVFIHTTTANPNDSHHNGVGLDARPHDPCSLVVRQGVVVVLLTKGMMKRRLPVHYELLWKTVHGGRRAYLRPTVVTAEERDVTMARIASNMQCAPFDHMHPGPCQSAPATSGEGPATGETLKTEALPFSKHVHFASLSPPMIAAGRNRVWQAFRLPSVE